MKARVIVAAVGVPLLLAVLFLLPPMGTAVLASIIAAVAAWEFLSLLRLMDSPFICVVTLATAFTVPLVVLNELSVAVMAVVYAVLMFGCGISRYERGKTVTIAGLCGAVFAALVVPLALSSLGILRSGNNGVYAVLLPFVAAFMCDTFALFGGMAFGKHKLSHLVSPHKTVEGSVCGTVMATVSMLLYAFILERCFAVAVSYQLMAVYGFLGSVVGQLGDLAFSLMKRIFGVKDYGNLLPGHGGALDRFDSIIFVSPVMCLLMAYFPAM